MMKAARAMVSSAGHADLAGKADRLGGASSAACRRSTRSGGADHQLRMGLDLARQALEGGDGGRFGKAFEGGAGDLAGAGQRQLGRTGPVVVGHRGQGAEAAARRLADLRQGLGDGLLGADDGRLLTLGEGLLADRLDLLGREAALGARRLVGDAALVVEGGVEGEAAGLGQFGGGFAHQ
jgi:hypothetical protein